MSFDEEDDDDAAMREQREANKAAMDGDVSDAESVASEAVSLASKASRASWAGAESDGSGVTDIAESLAECDIVSDVGSAASTAASASAARRQMELIRADITRQQRGGWVHVDVSEAAPEDNLEKVARRWTGRSL